MTLADWLKTNDKNLDWLAGQLGVTVASASRIVRGRQNPPLTTVGRIEQLTDGAVTAGDMLSAYQAAQTEQVA